MNCIFGVDKKLSGKIYLHQQDITPNSPFQAVKRGMAYITENRRGNGFFANFSIQQNIAISTSLKSGKFKGALGFINATLEKILHSNNKGIYKSSVPQLRRILQSYQAVISKK